MRLRVVAVKEGHVIVLDTNPNPSPDWQDDGIIRWLSVETATRGELESLFNRLGVDGAVIADHIAGDRWSDWIEREQFSLISVAAPTAWMERQRWFHLVTVPQTIVSVHGAEIPEMDAFIQRRWLDRPGPEPAMDAMVLHLIQCFVEDEDSEFDRIRLEVERHAEGFRCGDRSFDVEQLEDLVTRSNHMATVFFEYQRICEGVEFAKTRAISLETCREMFRRGAQNIRLMREGVEQLQRRLEGLQRQHLMDQQRMMEGRVRVLTILSAIFLPLTLIAGIYGMNFANMPELNETYAYFLTLAAMGVVGFGMISFFLWKGWFR